MEKIRLYPYSRGKMLNLVSRIITLLIIIVSLTGLIIEIVNGFNTAFPGGSWTPLLNLILGVILFWQTYKMKNIVNSFIEWDSQEIKYRLHNETEETTIKISDIKEVNIGLTDISLIFLTETKLLKLDNVEYKKLMRIKTYFEEIKLRVEGMNAGE